MGSGIRARRKKGEFQKLRFGLNTKERIPLDRSANWKSEKTALKKKGEGENPANLKLDPVEKFNKTRKETLPSNLKSVGRGRNQTSRASQGIYVCMATLEGTQHSGIGKKAQEGKEKILMAPFQSRVPRTRT